MHTITVGVDLAKQVFSVYEMDERGAVRQRHDLRREGFAVWLAQRPANTMAAQFVLGLTAMAVIKASKRIIRCSAKALKQQVRNLTART